LRAAEEKKAKEEAARIIAEERRKAEEVLMRQSKAEEERLAVEAEAERIAEELRAVEAVRIANERRQEEEAAQKAEEERLAAEAEEEARRKAEEEERQAAEAARMAEERNKAEEAALKAEEERLAAEAEAARIAEARRKAEEEAARKAEEERQAAEARIAEERRKEEEAAQKAEEERLAAEAESARKAEAARKAEEEAFALAEAERQAAVRIAEERRKAEEAARKAEEERLAAEAEEARKTEEERRVAEARRKAEEEAARKAEEKRQAEELRIAEERRKAQEAAQKAVEERLAAEEAARKAEAAQKAEEEAARKAEEERQAAEAARIGEERRKVEEAAQKAEEERLAAEAEAAQKAEASRKAEEHAEAARKAEEERAAEVARKAEEEAARKAEELRIADQRRKAQEVKKNEDGNSPPTNRTMMGMVYDKVKSVRSLFGRGADEADLEAIEIPRGHAMIEQPRSDVVATELEIPVVATELEIPMVQEIEQLPNQDLKEAPVQRGPSQSHEPEKDCAQTENPRGQHEKDAQLHEGNPQGEVVTTMPQDTTKDITTPTLDSPKLQGQEPKEVSVPRLQSTGRAVATVRQDTNKGIANPSVASQQMRGQDPSEVRVQRLQSAGRQSIANPNVASPKEQEPREIRVQRGVLPGQAGVTMREDPHRGIVNPNAASVTSRESPMPALQADGRNSPKKPLSKGVFSNSKQIGVVPTGDQIREVNARDKGVEVQQEITVHEEKVSAFFEVLGALFHKGVAKSKGPAGNEIGVGSHVEYLDNGKIVRGHVMALPNAQGAWTIQRHIDARGCLTFVPNQKVRPVTSHRPVVGSGVEVLYQGAWYTGHIVMLPADDVDKLGRFTCQCHDDPEGVHTYADSDTMRPLLSDAERDVVQKALTKEKEKAQPEGAGTTAKEGDKQPVEELKLMTKADEEEEFRKMFFDNGLGKFYPVFLEHGYDTLEMLQLLDDQELREFGLKSGHMAKFHAVFPRGNTYLIDKRRLRTNSPGLAYRDQMNLHGNVLMYAEWGTKVMGLEQDGGWLKVGLRYLPMMLDGVRVIFPEAEGAPMETNLYTVTEDDEPDEEDLSEAREASPVGTHRQANASRINAIHEAADAKKKAIEKAAFEAAAARKAAEQKVGPRVVEDQVKKAALEKAVAAQAELERLHLQEKEEKERLKAELEQLKASQMREKEKEDSLKAMEAELMKQFGNGPEAIAAMKFYRETAGSTLQPSPRLGETTLTTLPHGGDLSASEQQLLHFMRSLSRVSQMCNTPGEPGSN